MDCICKRAAGRAEWQVKSSEEPLEDLRYKTALQQASHGADTWDMKLTYNVTEADLMAYAAYHYDHSPVIQKLMTRGRMVLLIVALLFGLVAALLVVGGRCVQLSPLTQSLLIAAVGLTVVVVLVYVFHRRIFMWASRRMVRAGRNKEVLGPQSMAISDEGLTVTRPTGTTTTYWSGIARVEVAENAAYVFISANAAYIVPRVSVTEGDFDSFFAELRRRIAAK